MRINKKILVAFRILFFALWNRVFRKVLTKVTIPINKDKVIPKKVENMREISKIIIHCSASSFGDAKIIDAWHKENGWNEIGYHYIIPNGIRKLGNNYNERLDGKIELGRSIEKVGAHCSGHNEDSIGICLIGDPTKISEPEDWFTKKQIISLVKLVNELLIEYDIKIKDIHGHNEFSNKICPGFKVQDYLSWFGG